MSYWYPHNFDKALQTAETHSFSGVKKFWCEDKIEWNDRLYLENIIDLLHGQLLRGPSILDWFWLHLIFFTADQH